MQAVAYIQQFLNKNITLEKEKGKINTKNDPILCEIKDILTSLQNVRSRFDYETESDMIESLIFEEKALLSRYRYLILAAKNNGISCSHLNSLSLTLSQH